jgi:hypothetical protein
MCNIIIYQNFLKFISQQWHGSKWVELKGAPNSIYLQSTWKIYLEVTLHHGCMWKTHSSSLVHLRVLDSTLWNWLFVIIDPTWPMGNDNISHHFET